MFGSDILEVGLGMAFVFLLASLVCTAIKEGVESLLNKRATFLKRALIEMLGQTADAGIPARGLQYFKRWFSRMIGLTQRPDDLTGKRIKLFYDHPLIQSLYFDSYNPESHQNLPGYIPSGFFSKAVIDLILAEARGHSIPTQGVTGEQFQQILQALPDTAFNTRIKIILKDTQADLAAVNATLKDWFNQSMERVGDHYKVHSQQVILLIAAVVTMSLNINALTIAQRLSTDTALRKALVAQAEAEAKRSPLAGPENLNEAAFRSTHSLSAGTNGPVTTRSPDAAKTELPTKEGEKPEDAIKQLEKLGLPVGWGAFKWPGTFWERVSLIGGWLGTIFAISLGAPFWFDTLNRIIQLRAAVKPKSEDSGSISGNPTPPGQTSNIPATKKDS